MLSSIWFHRRLWGQGFTSSYTKPKKVYPNRHIAQWADWLSTLVGGFTTELIFTNIYIVGWWWWFITISQINCPQWEILKISTQ